MPPLYADLINSCCNPVPEEVDNWRQVAFTPYDRSAGTYGPPCRRKWYSDFCLRDDGLTPCNYTDMTAPTAYGCRSWARETCTTCTSCFNAGCPYIDEALAPLSPPPSPPNLPGWCPWDVQGTYGDVRQGSAAFAPVVGKACGGECYNSSSRWSLTGLAYGDAAVSSPIACRALCQETSGCQVWTLADGACTLMEAINGNPLVGVASVSTGAVSGSAQCGVPFLPFAEGIPPVQTSSQDPACFPDGLVYGGGVGACATPALIAVFATKQVLERGSVEEWWINATHLTIVDEALTEAR